MSMSTLGRYKVSITLVVLAIPITAFGYLYGKQAIALYEIRNWAKDHPSLSAQPQFLDTSSASTAATSPFTDFGYVFEVPLENVEGKRFTDSSFRIAAKSGQVVVFWDSKKAADLIKNIYSQLPSQRVQLAQAIGDLNTNYALEQAALNWTPDQVYLWMPRLQALRALALFSVKLQEEPFSTSGVFLIKTPQYRGFQFGDPDKSRQVAVRLYDAKDRQVNIHFLVPKEKDASVRFTQAEINRVIQSIVRLPDPSDEKSGK